MGSSLKREIVGIALLLFAFFLAAALGVLALAQMRFGVDVRGNVGWVGTWLAGPLVQLLGWPAAALTPLVPAVHSLRVFGRLQSELDRKWMIFFAGLVAVLPIAIGLALNVPLGERSAGAGYWGTFFAYYWRAWFGGIGAWVVLALAAIFPIRFEARNPGIRRQQGHLARGFAESCGRVLFNHGEKTAEVGKEHGEIERISYFGCTRAACFHSTRRGDAGAEGFLKSRDVFVEIQKLGGERVFGG